jgi:hypothetical protein
VKSALPESIHREGRIILIDNFYNTEMLVAWIKEQQLHLIGTVQPVRFNKGGSKSEPKPKWTLAKKAAIERGTMRVFNEIDEKGECQGMYFIFKFSIFVNIKIFDF